MSDSAQCWTTPEEHAALQREFARGEVELAIPRDVAQQFYLLTPLSDIRAKTGRTEFVAKATVYLGYLATPALALVCLLQIIWFHGWWAAMIIPIAGILWTVVAGLLNPIGRWWTVTLALLAAIAIYPSGILPRDVALPLIPYVASLWIDRLTYIAAGRFLVRLVVASRAAFEMLCDHIEVIRPAHDAG